MPVRYHFTNVRERARHLAGAVRVAEQFDSPAEIDKARRNIVHLAQELARPFAMLCALDGAGIQFAERFANEWIEGQPRGLNVPPRAYIASRLRESGYTITDTPAEPDGECAR